MNGSVPFEEALAARLSLFNPSLSQINDFLEKRPPRYYHFLYKKKNLFLFGKEENYLDFFISMDFGNNDQVYYASAFD